MLNGSLGQISNRATWINGFEVIDAETDDLMDLAGITITMKVARDPGGSVDHHGRAHHSRHGPCRLAL